MGSRVLEAFHKIISSDLGASAGCILLSVILFVWVGRHQEGLDAEYQHVGYSLCTFLMGAGTALIGRESRQHNRRATDQAVLDKLINDTIERRLR